MKYARVYQLSDVDLPESARMIKRVFLAPKIGDKPPPDRRLIKFLAEQERAKRKSAEDERERKQTRIEVEQG
jgi:hypothetical protein